LLLELDGERGWRLRSSQPESQPGSEPEVL
jgi:hypothetical protein